jgi:predicted RNA-binding Zn ribbon-like protein
VSREPDNDHVDAGPDPLLTALEPGPPAMPTGLYAVATIPLHGGRLCLDFTYTAVWRAAPAPRTHETLVDYPALLTFARRAGALDEDEADRLLAAADRPDEAAFVVARAIALREALYRIFVARIAARPPRPPDLARFNAELAEAMDAATVRFEDGCFVWDWQQRQEGSETSSLARPLWPIARSAAELLTGPELDRVKRCPGDGCGWLFLDASKNGSRRWCDMAGCGNRARVRAFAARKRAARRAATDP